MSYFNTTLSDLGFENQTSLDNALMTVKKNVLGDFQQHSDLAGGLFQTITNGTGAIDYEGGGVGGTRLSVTTNGDYVIRQSYQWHNYYAGNTQQIEKTFSLFGTETDVIKRTGYYSSDPTGDFDTGLDGFFFENDGTTVRVKVMRAGTTVVDVPQENWDNQDLLSSFAPEDFSYVFIQFLYLGGAGVKFWVKVNDNGKARLICVYEYTHIGVDANTFVKYPNQPIRCEIRSTGGAGTFQQICSKVSSIGEANDTGQLRTFNTDGTSGQLTGMATNNRYALLGVRHASGFRQVVFDFEGLSILSTSNDDLLLEVYFGGTTAGVAPWSAIPFTYAEGFRGKDIGSTANAIHSGGVLIVSKYLDSQASLEAKLRTTRLLGSFLDGSSEELYLCVTPLGSGAGAYASIIWRELY